MSVATKRKPYTECIIDGKIISYDFMGSEKNSYDKWNLKLKYLGYGSVYSVAGVLQDCAMKGHFWQIKGRR